MATIKMFNELLIWQESHKLVLKTYKITKLFPKEEMFILTSQIRRAAISVPANIVEGFRRKTLKDSLNFYKIADASLEELKYHLLLSKDLDYINEINYKEIKDKCETVGKLLTRWIQSQEQYLLT